MPTVTNRWVQHVWRLLENALIRKIKYFITQMILMPIGLKPIIRLKDPSSLEIFLKKSESPKSFVENHTKIILYQGAINYSRGIDKMIEAMQFIENAEFHIAGRGPFLEEYQQLTKNLHLDNKVKFLGNLHPDDLRKITEKADVGLHRRK
ncbi:MAG: glycosyltransferase [Cloacibacterium normanense]